MAVKIADRSLQICGFGVFVHAIAGSRAEQSPILLFTPTLNSHIRFMSAAHDPLYIEFIAHLRNMRKGRNLSQQQLGEKLGKDQTFISKVETCERRIDAIEAARWCIALGVRLEEVLPSEISKQLQREEE